MGRLPSRVLLLWLTARFRRRFDSSLPLLPRSCHDDATRFVEATAFGRHHVEFNAVARREPPLIFQRRTVDVDF